MRKTNPNPIVFFCDNVLISLFLQIFTQQAPDGRQLSSDLGVQAHATAGGNAGAKKGRV